MKTRIIHTKIWEDSFFSELSTDEKLIFIYLLTNERINIIHCYECTDRQIMFDTGIDAATLAHAKEKFAEQDKILFKDNYVFLKNAHKYEEFTGDKNELAKEKLTKQLNTTIKQWFISVNDDFKNTPIKGVYIPSINKKEEIINKKSKIEGGVGGDCGLTDEQREKNLNALREQKKKLFGVI
jgi:hypothetical protein